MDAQTDAVLERISSAHKHYFGNGLWEGYIYEPVTYLLNLLTTQPAHILFDATQKTPLKVNDPFTLLPAWPNPRDAVNYSAFGIVSTEQYRIFKPHLIVQRPTLISTGSAWHIDNLNEHYIQCAGAFARVLDHACNTYQEIDPNIWKNAPHIEEWLTYQNDRFVRALLNTSYWAEHPDALQVLADRNPNMSESRRHWIERTLGDLHQKYRARPQRQTETEATTGVSRLVYACQAQGSLGPLRAAIDQIEADGDILTSDMLARVGEAFGLLPDTFESIRALVNAFKPSAYPVLDPPAPAAKPKGLSVLFQLFQGEPKSAQPIKPTLTPAEQYPLTVTSVRRNLKAMRDAEDALYAIYRRGIGKAETLEKFADDIRQFLDGAQGHSLCENDLFLHKLLSAGASRLERGAQCLRFTAAFSTGLAERTIPLSDVLTNFLSGATISMTVHAATDVISKERYGANIETAIGKMLDITKWVTTEFKLNATLFGEASDKGANMLLESAHALHAQLEEIGQPLLNSLTFRPDVSGACRPAVRP